MPISYGPSGNAANLIAQAKTLYENGNSIATTASTNLSIVSNFKLAIRYDMLDTMRKPLDLSGMDWNSRARDSLNPVVQSFMSNLSLRIDTVSVNVVAVAGMAKSEYLSQKCSNYMDKVNSLTKTIRDLNTRRSALISSLSTLKASMETELAILKSKMISATNTIESANYNINMIKQAYYL